MSDIDRMNREIDEANVLKDFIEHEVVAKRFTELKDKFYHEFLNSKNPAEREQVWAKVQALDELKTAIQAGIDSGKIAQAQRKQWVATEEQAERKRRTR